MPTCSSKHIAHNAFTPGNASHPRTWVVLASTGRVNRGAIVGLRKIVLQIQDVVDHRGAVLRSEEGVQLHHRGLRKSRIKTRACGTNLACKSLKIEKISPRDALAVVPMRIGKWRQNLQVSEHFHSIAFSYI